VRHVPHPPASVLPKNPGRRAHVRIDLVASQNWSRRDSLEWCAVVVSGGTTDEDAKRDGDTETPSLVVEVRSASVSNPPRGHHATIVEGSQRAWHEDRLRRYIYASVAQINAGMGDMRALSLVAHR